MGAFPACDGGDRGKEKDDNNKRHTLTLGQTWGRVFSRSLSLLLLAFFSVTDKCDYFRLGKPYPELGCGLEIDLTHTLDLLSTLLHPDGGVVRGEKKCLDDGREKGPREKDTWGKIGGQRALPS